MSIDDIVKTEQTESNNSWVVEGYAKEWKTSIDHMAAWSVSFIGCMSTVYLASKVSDSDAVIGSAAATVDGLAYWSTFIYRLRKRDKKTLEENPDLKPDYWKKTIASYGLLAVSKHIPFMLWYTLGFSGASALGAGSMSSGIIAKLLPQVISIPLQPYLRYFSKNIAYRLGDSIRSYYCKMKGRDITDGE